MEEFTWLKYSGGKSIKLARSKEKALMRKEEVITAVPVASLSGIAGKDDHGAGADDIDVERVQNLSSAENERTFNSRPAGGTRTRRYKLILNIVQKVNMCFLVLFIGYFVWTVSANHANRFSGVDGSAWNQSGVTNTSVEVSHTSYFNTDFNKFTFFTFII